MTHVIVTGNMHLFDMNLMNLAVLSMGTLFPATLGPSAQFQNQIKERHLLLWARLPLSRTQLGLAFGLVFLTPWPLAMASYLGLGLWWLELPSALFAWSGLVLAFIALVWLMAMVLGPTVAHITMFALYVSTVIIEPSVLLFSTVLGWGFVGSEPYRPGTVWQWLQEPSCSGSCSGAIQASLRAVSGFSSACCPCCPMR